MGRPSVKDVAARAGVSLGTVSNVLNRPDAVRPETRARVEAAIQELGFVRNASARQLRQGVSHTIAYVVLDAGNPFFTDVARGVEDEAREHDLAVYLCNSAEDPARERAYLDQLLQQRVRGVCITPAGGSHDQLHHLVQAGIPVVLVDRRAADEPFCSVGVDDVTGGSLAATHLLERGHDRVAFVGPRAVLQSADRLDGARKAFSAVGKSDEDLVVLETDSMTVGEGRVAGQRLLGLSRRRRPTSVFCANDLLALGLLQQLMQTGVSVPDDIAIVGYDDIEFAAAAAVPLTSVMQPRLRLGRTAAQLLVDESANSDHVHRHVEFMPELVVRQSSGR